MDIAIDVFLDLLSDFVGMVKMISAVVIALYLWHELIEPFLDNRRGRKDNKNGNSNRTNK